MMHHRNILAVFAALALALPGAKAQGAPQRAPGAAAIAGPGEIRGRLVDPTGHAVTGGSVTIRKASDTSFVGGALPKPDGSFQVLGLAPGRYVLRARALGYAPLAKNAITITESATVVDVGTLTLSTVVATQLGAEQVVAERPDVVLAPDRNVYSTKNMATASGGTAIDVLRNIPSVEVDASNKVSLRGNANVVVQINGRPSPLTGDQLGIFLSQLPAGTVKNVEVATNPSAKSDPEGTAGIINIVLNQETEVGLSGGVNASTSSTGMVNGGGNIGTQKGKLILYLNANVFRDRRSTNGFSHRTYLTPTSPAAFTESASNGLNRPMFGGGSFRSEYRLNAQDALSLDAYANGGSFGGDQTTRYSDLDAARAPIQLLDVISTHSRDNNSRDATLAYRRTPAQGKGAQSGTTFSNELRYSRNAFSDDALLGTTTTALTPAAASALAETRDLSSSTLKTLTAQSDITSPFSDRTKLEWGAKVMDRSTGSALAGSMLDASGAFVTVPSRTTAFDYDERINSAYGVLSQAVGKVQLQGGLRLEDAKTHLGLPILSQAFDNHYGSAFPSAIASYNLTPMQQVKASYSRRVSRPSPFQLSPVASRSDARSAFQGNPYLAPEYTDALEFTIQDAHPWGSLQISPYMRYTAHAITNIQRVDSTGISVFTFENLASNRRTGADVNLSAHPGKFMLFGGFGINKYHSDARNISGNPSVDAVNWRLNGNVTYKVTKTADAQAFVFYNAAARTEGGSRPSMTFMNLALRQKLWGDQGSVSLRVSDPFNMARFGYTTQDDRTIEVSEQHFQQRAITLSFSRNFGQQLKLRPQRADDTPAAAPTPGTP